jgi:hypothetical protein
VLDITVKAPPEAGISAVSEIKAELASALKRAGADSRIIFDMSKTARADSSLAQLLIAFQKEAISKKVAVEIRDDDNAYSMKALLCCDNCVDCCGVKHDKLAEPSGGAS